MVLIELLTALIVVLLFCVSGLAFILVQWTPAKRNPQCAQMTAGTAKSSR
jgi:hypothetical protein